MIYIDFNWPISPVKKSILSRGRCGDPHGRLWYWYCQSGRQLNNLGRFGIYRLQWNLSWHYCLGQVTEYNDCKMVELSWSVMVFLQLFYSTVKGEQPSCRQMNYGDEFRESRASQPPEVACVSGTCHQWTVYGSQCAGYYTL